MDAFNAILQGLFYALLFGQSSLGFDVPTSPDSHTSPATRNADHLVRDHPLQLHDFSKNYQTYGSFLRKQEADNDLSKSIASLLLELVSDLGQCALALTTDRYLFPALDLFLSGNMNSGEGIPSSVVNFYEQIGKESCASYIFLIEDSEILLFLLESLYEENLNLLAKFVFVTSPKSFNVSTLLRASPISKIVNAVLVTFNEDSTLAELQLYHHVFFQDDQIISEESLGTWKFNQNSSKDFVWFSNKLSNFHGYKFRVTTFNHPPSSVFETDENGGISYDGLEIRLLMTLAYSLNFSVDISKPRDGEKWGRRLQSGEWTGAMGETIRGETEVSFANYFITADRLKIIDMTRFYHIDYTCFITPMPQPLPQYSAVAWPFQFNVWIGVFLVLILIPPVVRLTGTLESGTWFRNLGNTFLYVVGIFLTRSQPLRLVPLSDGLRVAIITSWLAAMVLSVAYKSSLIAFLLVPLPAQPVNTLEDLLKSDLHWGVRNTGGWDKWFSNSIDPTSRKISEGFEFVQGIEGGLARVQEGDFAFMNSGTFLQYLISSNFTNEFGQTELHITRECFVPFRIGLGMPRFSVYTSKFNAIISRVVEGGMVSHWFQDLLAKAEKKQRKKAKEKQSGLDQDYSSSVGKNLSLYHVQGPLFLLLAGWILSACSLALEIFLCGSRGSESEKI